MVSSPPAITPVHSPNQSITPITTSVNAAGHLTVGGCDVLDLAAQFGTPLYIVDEATLRQSCRLYRNTLIQAYAGPSQVLYATKAWNCTALCALVRQEGLGLDVASGGELYTALQAGAQGSEIYLHGNAKSDAELQMAAQQGVTIVANGLDELQRLQQIVGQDSVRVMVRVNPGIDVHTHEYIRTGQVDSKFGVGLTQLQEVWDLLVSSSQLNFVGLHAHIGSQIFDLQGHRDLGSVMAALWQQTLERGLQPSELNVGGGLGVCHAQSDDPPSIREWVEAVSQGVQRAFSEAKLPLPKLLCEPGRSLIGPTTITAYRVEGSKTIPATPERPQGRTYLMLDGGMSDNPRPITYQAPYTAIVANRPQDPPIQEVTLAGKHCESGDVIIQQAPLPQVERGDVVVVCATGAYNYSMASNYNRYPRPAAVLVQAGQATVIVRRETYADLVRQDVLPSHLQTEV
jgi:diaminopimelate decarboxylase